VSQTRPETVGIASKRVGIIHVEHVKKMPRCCAVHMSFLAHFILQLKINNEPHIIRFKAIHKMGNNAYF